MYKQHSDVRGNTKHNYFLTTEFLRFELICISTYFDKISRLQV